jgi:hypothetical protein
MGIHKRAILEVLCLVSFVSSAMANGFPEISGWQAKGQAETFNTENIWKAIDGAAELYMAYGFMEMQVLHYTKEGVKISISVFNQSQALNSFGVFMREKNSKATKVSAGTWAVAWPPHQCLMIKDRYYVKIDAVKGKLSASDCLVLLTAMDGSLPGKTELPDVLGLLPTKNRVDNTLGYTKKSFLGLSNLKNCLHALYSRADGEEYLVFTFVASKGQSNEAIFAELSESWDKKDKAAQPTLTKEIPYRGLVAVTLTPKGVFGVADAGENSTTLSVLKTLLKEKKEEKKGQAL